MRACVQSDALHGPVVAQWNGLEHRLLWVLHLWRPWHAGCILMRVKGGLLPLKTCHEAQHVLRQARVSMLPTACKGCRASSYNAQATATLALSCA